MCKNRKIIEFKSEEHFFLKEMKNIRNNTVRVSDNGNRFILLKDFLDMKNLYPTFIYPLFIRIFEKNNNKKYFTRLIKDVSIFNDLFIISWYTHQEIMMNEELYDILARNFDFNMDTFTKFNSLRSLDEENLNNKEKS